MIGRALEVLAAAAVAVAPAPAHAQETPRATGWEVAPSVSFLRADGDLARSARAQWLAAAGIAVAYRLAPEASLGMEAWRGALDEAGAGSRAAWGVSARLRVLPWVDRGWPVDPEFSFGIEGLGIDDDEKRGASFVSGLGVRRALGRRVALSGGVRNHFLTVREASVDGRRTSRDAMLWEGRLAVELQLGASAGR